MEIYEEKIQALLDQMTLEEKVGQLQQCGPSLVGAFEVSFEELLDMMFDGRISQEEFGRLMAGAKQDYHEEDLKAGRIGSYNGVSDAETVNRLQKIAVEETRLGIPLLFGCDVIHGFKTITPIPLAESCAWEPKLWEKTARMSAEEATAAGVHMTFAPMVDVAKDARWGRVSEGAGEDVLMNSLYGAAKVRGFQGDDLSKDNAMAACLKHFAGYGAVEAGRDYNRVDMSMQKLFEEYLPSYKACVEAGARAVMPAFNDISGVPCTTNQWLLKDLLRDQWGFDGMTVSDANAIAECVNHGIAADRRDAAKQALEAGVDMDMTSNCYIENIQALVESGELDVKVLDRAVADILRVKFELGLFDHPYKTTTEREAKSILTPEARAIAREAAQKSIVLLKNEDILPLKKGTKLGIFGPNADDREQMTGAWAVSADGQACVSLIDACNAQAVLYQYGDESQVEEIAAASDVLIAVLGEQKEESGEAASRADITLPETQYALVDKLLATGKPVVAILFNGRPLAIPELAEKVPAIVEAWHPGTEAGHAVLDILFGEVNPSAKLTTSFPYAVGQCPLYYAHINTGRPGGKSKFTSKYLDVPNDPLYPFGFGLSYTQYAYENLSVTRSENAYEVSVIVKNVGNMAGDEVVQCYFRDVAAARVRPLKQLKAFDKVHLEPGEEKQVIMSIDIADLGYFGPDMKYRTDPGEFIFYVGGSSKDCLEQSVIYEG